MQGQPGQIGDGGGRLASCGRTGGDRGAVFQRLHGMGKNSRALCDSMAAVWNASK